jgi:adenosylcobinamide-GDP ribazoletransferase
MLRPLVVALGFLTRLPVRAGDVQPHELGRAVACFPLVGALLGALAFGAQRLVLSYAGAALTSVLVIASWAWITGGLHLDGVSDVFDGLGGGRGDRERVLSIMRDSRIGSHGAVALVLLLVAKVLSLGELLARGIAWPVLAAPICARWVVVALVAFFPYAREQGLGKAFHEQTRGKHVVVATVLALAGLVPFGMPALYPVACSLGVAFALAFWIERKLAGLTGDVYGAAVEFAELAFLVACHVTQHAAP